MEKMDGETVFNSGKLDKMETKSLRPHLAVYEKSFKDVLYKFEADTDCRSNSLRNVDGDWLSIVAKTGTDMLL